MKIRLTKVDEYQFLTCLEHEVWGSKTARFKEWNQGDYLVILVDKAVAAVAEISGEPYISKQKVWDNGAFPHRIPLNFVHAMLPENRPPLLGKIREVLTANWTTKYGWGILNQQALEGDSAKTIIDIIFSKSNDLKKIKDDLDSLLTSAKVLRDTVSKSKKKRKKIKETKVENLKEEESSSKQEESVHTKAQKNLIDLGIISGCSVWVAANDKNRQYRGKSLGDGCLKALPNLGLSEEAKKRISLIDIIWVKQNAPLCAFEVEATSSIYSGLLRMADLLSVVPALNIKLYIIAPKERQDKVMRELARPTFQAIGLSEYCKFISIEDVTSLLDKVEGLEGHIQHSIVDTVAVELEDEVGSSLD